MRTSSLGPVSVAAAVAFVGALVLGVPFGPLVLLAVALACLLMMIFMMKGRHGGEGNASERRYSRRWRAPRSNH